MKLPCFLLMVSEFYPTLLFSALCGLVGTLFIYFLFYFFFVVLGFELRAYTLSHATSPCW
jgi:hypothetical protein